MGRGDWDFVGPLFITNWVKVDEPLSEPPGNCSGHKNKLFGIWSVCVCVLLSNWSEGN